MAVRESSFLPHILLFPPLTQTFCMSPGAQFENSSDIGVFAKLTNSYVLAPANLHSLGKD